MDNNWVRITPHYKIVISKNLRYSHFSNGEKVGLFIDIKNFLLGFKPQKEGYKLSVKGRIEAKKLRKYGLGFGRYNAQWDKKHNMIIIKVKEIEQ